MKAERLVEALSSNIPEELATDLVSQFMHLRQDLATSTLERSSPGKFVETLVQTLQWLESGRFDPQPNVDQYLRNLESRTSTLVEGLRICASRIGRVMYTLRSKRNIVHKNEIDPNMYDLRLLHAASQWILAELVRTAQGVSMKEAGDLVDQIQAPVNVLVEVFEDRRLVLQETSTREEILVLLHSYYPELVTIERLRSSLDRRSAKTVGNVIPALWRERLLEGNPKMGFKLTQRGYVEADAFVRKLLKNS